MIRRHVCIVGRERNHIVGFIKAADRRFDLTGRQIEQRTVKSPATLRDLIDIAQCAIRMDVIQRGRGIALKAPSDRKTNSNRAHCGRLGDAADVFHPTSSTDRVAIDFILQIEIGFVAVRIIHHAAPAERQVEVQTGMIAV